MQCTAHAPAELSAAAKALRHRARRACRAEMTRDNASMHLYAMDVGMRASHARQCRICCYQPKSEKAEGGLHDVFDRADLVGKKGAQHVGIVADTPHARQPTCRCHRT